jgi:hypothetical protein
LNSQKGDLFSINIISLNIGLYGNMEKLEKRTKGSAGMIRNALVTPKKTASLTKKKYMPFHSSN